MIAGLDRSDSFADTFNNTTAFVSENAWEETLWIGSAQGVQVGVADSGGQDTNANLTSLWRSNGNGLNLQWLVCFPCHGC